MNRYDAVLGQFEKNREWMEETVARGVESGRKGNAKLIVRDERGNPVSGAKIRARQTKHAFMYGCNLFMLDEMETPAKNEAYQTLVKRGFNLATLPFYWSDLEPEMGKPRFSENSPRVYRRPAPDKCLKYCEESGVSPKLHCLNYDQWTPVWVKRETGEVKRLLDKRMREIGEKYASRIRGVEVTNESFLRPVDCPDRKSTPFFREDDFIEWSFTTARKYFPQNELIINEASQVWMIEDNRHPYFMQIERALSRGAQIDAIGMQFHSFWEPGDEARNAQSYYDPKRLYKAMDFYARFGKPLQVTEVTIPAYSADAEDEKIQAKLIENLYQLWFAHPAMEAVIYWNLVDGYAAFAPQGDMKSGENRYYGALVRFDMSKKPAYDALDELFNHRFRTDETVETGANGDALLRGFYGDYELTVEKNGQKRVFSSSILKNGTEVTELRL